MLSCECECKCDPFTKLLGTFFQEFIKLLPFTSKVEALFGKNDDDFESLIQTLTEHSLESVNIKAALNVGISELEASWVPSSVGALPITVLNFWNVQEVVKNAWKSAAALGQFSTETLPEFESCCSNPSEDMFDMLEGRLGDAGLRQTRTGSGFCLDVENLAYKSITWSLENLPYEGNKLKCHGRDIKKVEIAMKELEVEERSSESDSKCFMAKSVLNLLRTVGYIVERDEYIVIPEAVETPDILVAFYDDVEKPEDKLLLGPVDVVGISCKKFYEKYSNAVSILYNYARITTILTRYDELIEHQGYPSLPVVNEVDFSCLPGSREEAVVIVYLAHWPRFLNHVVNLDRTSHEKISFPALFEFIKAFVKKFESYYNHVMIIVPKDVTHNHGTMIARLYLLQAVKKVFEQFMEMGGIEIASAPTPESQGL